MNNSSRLKPVNKNGIIIGIAASILLFIVFIVIWISFGERTVDKIAGMIFSLGALIHAVVWSRTKNTGYLLYLAWNALMALRLIAGWEDPILVWSYRGVLLLLLLIYFFLLAGGSMTWKYRKILEIAARPVKSAEDGFTPRPFPAGTAAYTKEQIIAFGKFLARHLAVFPYIEPGRIVLVVSHSELRDFLFMRQTTLEDTFVSFDFDGEVTVNIARKEYDQYKEELTFDQLCASLGNLFKILLGYYQAGEYRKIMDTINGKGV